MLYSEVGTVCMSKVESSRRCEYHSEQSYDAIILILLIRKKFFVATIDLENPVTD